MKFKKPVLKIGKHKYTIAKPSQLNTLSNMLAFVPADKRQLVKMKLMADMEKPIRKQISEGKNTQEELLDFIYKEQKGEFVKICERDLSITKDDWIYVVTKVLLEAQMPQAQSAPNERRVT